MKEKTVSGDMGHLEIPNVSQVPQYSPLRYPGGKSRWYPFLTKWLSEKSVGNVLVEPFAGGASMGLAAGIEDLVDQVILVEKNEDVGAFWKTVFENKDWLLENIRKFEVSRENVERAFEGRVDNVYERGFLFLLNNRMSRGGITADGNGLLRKGENDKGLKSRWYPKTLSERIELIYSYKDRFEFVFGDGIEVMSEKHDKENACFFIDPPYTSAGQRLYDDSEIDHGRLFKLMAQLEGRFLATYDDTDQIRGLARKHDFDVEEVLMRTTHHEEKFELLVSEKFEWLGRG